MQLHDVPRVTGASWTTVEREYVATQRPVVLKGAGRSLSQARWTLPQLVQREGARTLPVRFFPDGNIDGLSYVHQPMTLAELASHLQSEDPAAHRYYLGLCPIEQVLGETPHERLSGMPCDETFVWLGRSTFAQMHWHQGVHAIAEQVMGRKTFVLYPPEESHKLHPQPWYSPAYNFSAANFRDLKEVERHFPSVRQARGWSCVLEPGDMLFIPTHWWHAVYGPGVSLLLTHVWTAALRQWLHTPLALRTLGRRAFPVLPSLIAALRPSVLLDIIRARARQRAVAPMPPG